MGRRHRLAGSARLLLRYLAARRSLPGRYERAGLDELLGSVARAAPLAPVRVGDAARVLRLAERVAPRVSDGPNTCLFRALARYEVLAAAGLPVTFRLGVEEGGGLPGHAWVEVGGEPFLEPGIPRFVTVLSHPAGGAPNRPPGGAG